MCSNIVCVLPMYLELSRCFSCSLIVSMHFGFSCCEHLAVLLCIAVSSAIYSKRMMQIFETNKGAREWTDIMIVLVKHNEGWIWLLIHTYCGDCLLAVALIHCQPCNPSIQFCCQFASEIIGSWPGAFARSYPCNVTLPSLLGITCRSIVIEMDSKQALTMSPPFWRNEKSDFVMTTINSHAL